MDSFTRLISNAEDTDAVEVQVGAGVLEDTILGPVLGPVLGPILVLGLDLGLIPVPQGSKAATLIF